MKTNKSLIISLIAMLMSVTGALAQQTTVYVKESPDLCLNLGTFYDKDASYTVTTSDVAIYTASVEYYDDEYRLVLHQLTYNVIPKDTPVILCTESSTEVTLTPCSDTSDITIPANSLSGADQETTAPENCYILSYGQHGTSFYKYAEGKELDANKAYLIYSPSALDFAPALRMTFSGK